MPRPLRPWRRQTLLAVYRRLLSHNGHAGWWPGESPFEICLGAILTQNTAWSNVARALDALRSRQLLSFEALEALPPQLLAALIRPSGYFNVKARRVRAFLEFLRREYGGRVEPMGLEAPARLRARLLAVPGVGRETADSIALYAAGLPLFVVDAYTRRIFARLGFLEGGEDYDDIAGQFMRHLPRDAGLYNDFHAQIVLLGKNTCRPRPRCRECPLLGLCERRGARKTTRDSRRAGDTKRVAGGLRAGRPTRSRRVPAAPS
jgi:endonuclease-3 related protein